MFAEARRIVARLRHALGSQHQAEEELAREMAAHLAVLEDEFRRSGMTPDEAGYAARRAMGGAEQAKELQRDARSFTWIAHARRDFRLALRTLARARGFTALTIATLGAGIGSATAVYSAFDAALLRPLPFREPDRLVRVTGISVPIDMRDLHHTDGTASSTPPVRTQADISDLVQQRDVFTSSAAHATGAANLGSGVQPVRVDITFVTDGFFATLGRSAALGRVFSAAEIAGGSRVTILSDRLWRSQFGADPAILGQRVQVDAVPHEVIGVMPADFRFPAPAQLWVPLPLPVPRHVFTAFRNFLPSTVVARLAPGVTVPLAAERIDALRRRYAPENGPATPPSTATIAFVTPLQNSLIGDRRQVLVVLMASAGLVLFIACANAATLLLARAAGRRREMATHAILGATRARLLVRLLIENVLLATAAALLGVAIASLGLSLLASLIPPGLDGLAPLQMDRRVLGFAVGAAALTTLLFGLWPALGMSRAGIGRMAGTGSREVTASHRLTSGLVVVQVAIACLLAIGGALMTSSLRTLLATSLGIQVDRVASARVNLPAAVYPDSPALARFIRGTLAALEEDAGVEAAAAINTLPLAREPGIALRVDPDGPELPPSAPRVFAPYLVAAPGYFQTMGIPLLQGRDLAWSDHGGAPVAVVNRSLARQLWPGQDPLGKRIRFGGPPRTVVGVVGDARIADLSTDSGAQIYLPIQEQPQNYVSFVVRGAPGAMTALADRIRAAVRSVDPSVPIYAVLPMADIVGDLVAARRLNTILIGGFATVALGLAAIGVYGVLACSVAQRARELGVRVALGAQRREVLTLVLRQGLILIAAGLLLGLAAGLGATRYLQTLLYGVTPRDPATFLAVAVTLTVVGLLAAFVPARRAAAADPLTVLRSE